MSLDPGSELRLPPIDHEAPRRMRLLQDLGLGAPEEEFDEFAIGVAERVGVPCAMVNVFNNGEQNFVGLHAPAAQLPQVGRTMPMEYGFCPEFVTRRKPLILPDIGAYPRFAGNPVVDLLGLRTYAGAPLLHDDGTLLGSVCALGPTAMPLESSHETWARITDCRDALMDLITRRAPRYQHKLTAPRKHPPSTTGH